MLYIQSVFTLKNTSWERDLTKPSYNSGKGMAKRLGNVYEGGEHGYEHFKINRILRF